MNDTTLMEIPDGINDRADDISGLLLSIDLLFHNFLIQLSACQILQNKVDILFICIEIIELNNIRMADIFHDIDFPLEQNLLFLIHLLSELKIPYFLMILIATGLPVFFYLPFTTLA